jgi:signal transduction histidine kinase
MNYSRFLTLFVWGTLILALPGLIWTVEAYRCPPPGIMVLFTIVLYILTNFKIKVPRVANEISITWPVTFFGIWLWGPWISLTLIAAVFIYLCWQIWQEWKLFKEYFNDYLLSTVYNISYCSLITCLPGILYFKLGGISDFMALTPSLFIALASSAASCYLISSIATNIRIALFENKPPWKLCIDPLSELMELALVSFSIIGAIVFNRMGLPYLFLLVIPAVLGLYILNFGIRASTEKDDINLLYNFTSLITRSLNLEMTLKNAAEGAMVSVNAGGCAIFFMDTETGCFKKLIALGTIDTLPPELERSLSSALLEDIQKLDYSVSSYKESEVIKNRYFPSVKGEIIVVQFHAKQGSPGIMLLNKNQFERDHRDFLTIIADRAGMGIANAHLYLHAIELNRQLQAIQAQLVQSSKMTAVGQLASGVAHRLNRPMKKILENFNKVSSGVEKTEKLERRLNISQKAIIRCLDIHDKLLHYTGKSDRLDEDIDVWALIDDTMDFFIKLLEKDNVKVTMKRSAVKPIKGNADYLSQVLTNLVINGRDALIASGNKEKVITIETGDTGKCLLITVRDNGTGMSRAVQERIFEPFYTTKDIGSGTGLGLSVSLEIVKRFGGRILVESQEGSGSAFTLELPYNYSEVPGSQALAFTPPVAQNQPR